MALYCGNNAAHPDLVSGRSARGTRYQCFIKGIGIGKALPRVNKQPYIPIDPRKVYCGKSDNLVAGYAIMGNAAMCLQKGVGVGRAINSISPKRSKKKSPNRRSPKRRAKK